MADISIEHSLELEEYPSEDCNLALRGEKIPRALGYAVTRLCTIHGIRHHPGFATELHGTSDEFTRALNARDVMSNAIPDMKEPEEFPYCIWHPEVASESTYRSLTQRYPQMKYQVGRACAVGGYTGLYRELELVPDVHIAEEALENGNTEIFEMILGSNAMYSVMSDYKRSVNTENPSISQLNGDTATRSSLEIKQKHGKPREIGYSLWEGYEELYFNITEDMNIFSSTSPPAHSKGISQMLYAPLPLNLPSINKDLLILIAAYHGNIDRYDRLRRPVFIPMELNCVIRGIYHNVFFAKYWSIKIQAQPQLDPNSRISRAVNARCIMSNDLLRITKDTPKRELPYCIWYPKTAKWSTYQELARRRPDMVPQLVRACIVADYETTFDELVNDVVIDEALIAEAKASANRHYLEVFEEKVSKGAKVKLGLQGWMTITRKEAKERGTTWLVRNIGTQDVDTSFEGIYDGLGVDISAIELNVCVGTDGMKEGEDVLDLEEAYGKETAISTTGNGNSTPGEQPLLF